MEVSQASSNGRISVSLGRMNAKETYIISMLSETILAPKIAGVFSIALALRQLANISLASGESDSITWTSDSNDREFILNFG